MSRIILRERLLLMAGLTLALVAGPVRGDEPVLYAPDVVMAGRRFMIALKVSRRAGAVDVQAPPAVELHDRTRLPATTDQRRFYFRALTPGKVEIAFRIGRRKVSVPIEVLTFKELLQPRTINRIRLPRRWPLGEELSELKQGHTLLTPKEAAALKAAQANPTTGGSWRSDDYYWALQPESQIPRWHWVNLPVGCPVHGTEIYRRRAYYPWIKSLAHPWKLRCPVGKEWYPSNVFAKGDMTSGPFPDDGAGCVHKGKKYAFIAVYWQYQCRQAAASCIRAARSYLKTGDPRAAHKGLVMLARIALETGYLSAMINHRYRACENVVQRMDLIGPPRLDEVRTLKRSGLTDYCIATPRMLISLAKAYDIIWGTVDGDPKIVPFLQTQGLDVQTGEDVRRFIETHLFRVGAQAVMDGSAASNLPRPQAAMGTIIQLLNYERGPELMDWLYDGAGQMRVFLSNYYFKDGIAYESPGYNGTHVRDIAKIADMIEDIRGPRPGLYPEDKYPRLAGSRRHRSVFDAAIDYVCIDRAYPSVGDDGTWPKYAALKPKVATPGADAGTMLHAYRTYRSPKFAWALRQYGVEAAEGIPKEELAQRAADLPADFRDQSMLFDGYGIATLRSGTGEHKRVLWLKYGRFRSHVHDNVFEMGLMARQSHVLTHFGYPRNWNYWYKSWTTHNVAREIPFKEHMGFPTLFGDAPSLHVFEARSEAYKQSAAAITPVVGSFQRRTLALIDVSPTDFYCVDAYRISGGREHWWAFHCQEGQFGTEGLDLKPQPKGTLAGPDVAYGDQAWLKNRNKKFFAFPYLYNVQKAQPQGAWRADWRLKGSDGLHFRLHVASPPGTDINICDGKSAAGGSPYEMKFILAQRKGKAPLHTQMVSVMELYDGKAPLISEARSVGISRGPDAEGFEPVALRVKAGTRTDHIMLSTDPQVERQVEGGIEFAGRFGLYAERDGKPAAMVLVGGTKLMKDGFGITCPEGAYRGKIVAVDREHQAITVAPAPAKPSALVGACIFILNEAHRVAYRVLDAKQVKDGVRLALDLDARTGVGRVTTVADYAVRTSSEFRLAGWRYYHGARLVNQAGTAEYRLLDVKREAAIDRAAHPEARAARLAEEFPAGTWFEVWDYGVGDEVEWHYVLSVRREESGRYTVDSPVKANVKLPRR